MATTDRLGLTIRPGTDGGSGPLAGPLAHTITKVARRRTTKLRSGGLPDPNLLYRKTTGRGLSRQRATLRIDSALARHVGLGPSIARQYDRAIPDYVVAEVATAGPHRVSVSAPIVVYDGPSIHYEYLATLTWTFAVR